MHLKMDFSLFCLIINTHLPDNNFTPTAMETLYKHITSGDEVDADVADVIASVEGYVEYKNEDAVWCMWDIEEYHTIAYVAMYTDVLYMPNGRILIRNIE